MGTGSLLRGIGSSALAAAAGLQNGGGAVGATAAWPAAVAAAGSAGRLLIEEGGVGMSAGMKVGYVIISVVLVVVSGLMAGLVLGLLSLDKVDLEVAKRTGTQRQKWLVERVEPFTHHPHYTMCALVVVNAACNTALPLFIDRLLNPLAAILISVTAVLLFAEIAPQAVCKRYGLEIGAYCAPLVRLLMVLTAPVAWPLGKLLDWLLGEESALFRRQELKALVGLHAEPQQDGSVGALTSDEVQVIQGALDMAGKTAESVMTPLAKVFMLPADAVINKRLLEGVIAAGHSRVPVHEGDNKQAILGLILVKDLLLVDETAGVRVRDVRLRDMPFLRADIPLYDVLKIFRFGRRHMACLTQVATDPSTKGSSLRLSSLFRRPSPAFGGMGDKHVEEAVGIITIEDVLEELLQAEIVDETDQYIDNLQTVHVPQQVSLKELPPNLRRFLSPRRSMHGYSLAAGAGPHAFVEVARLSATSRASSEGPSHEAVTAEALPAGDAGEEEERQQAGQEHSAFLAGTAHATAQPQVQQERSSPLPRRAPSPALPSLPSLGAAAAASALMVAGGPASRDTAALTSALTAGVRAAELTRAGSGASSVAPSAQLAASRAPTPQPQAGTLEGRATPSRPPLPRSQRPSGAGRHSSEAVAAAAAPGAGAGQPPGQPPADFLESSEGRGVSSGSEHVTVELGELHLSTTSEGDGWGGGWGGDEPQARPLVKPGSRGSVS
ncbi:hypothetical protein ABPG75_000482 [Micractinium tetrahymenae]